MNNRIKELIQAADRKCSETRGVYDEILAELIVKQCIAQIETMLYSPDENPPQDEWLRGYDAGGRRAIEILKLDFGIKE